MRRHVLHHYHLSIIVSSSLMIILAYAGADLAQSCEKPVAKVASVQGTVESQRAGDTQWQPVRLNNTYCPGDTIRVQERSRADVALANRSVLRLNANSTITLEGVKEDRSYLVALLKGAAHFFSRGPRSLEVRTPFTTAGVRGTEFYLSVEGDKTLLSIFEGNVLASNESGSLDLTSGQSAVAEKGKAPVLRLVARPRDAVQWALYYPPVVYMSPKQFQANTGWEKMVQRSNDFYLQGDLQTAFEQIAKAPESLRDPRFFAYRASLLLAVGRVDEARSDIGQALRFDPNDSHAAALQTIMAVVQNDKDRALQIAQKAVAAAPDVATSHVALSYAQQAHFDLVGARASLEKAVTLEPENALAWARLAELWSSFGDLDKALEAAQQAVILEPNLSRTQTVLGFVFLTRVQTTPAKVAFEKAIVRDQADPLPRLGLGLAKIREGKLSEGAQDMETATSLSPNNSLLHSYLGKTRFEEKQWPLDEREYRVAKELDPKDPTPWFYDAIQKQTTNRPVEALQDLQKAIELNDNRAVFRSRLALDSDLAARSSSLGRIYSDLGFQQRALVEGWNAVNTDPSNFSAHRFLADSYAVLPRHEIARVSELLQSQLLQPLNMTPIQPSLAESSLFLISAGGPGASSFNEFNPLFNRNGVTVQTSGLLAENETWSGEGVIAGIFDKLSFSLGVSHFETDGFRQNSGQDDDIFNAFVQMELSPKTSMQAEFRRRETHTGDIHLRFFPEDFFPNQKNLQETVSIRYGVRHSIAPGSILLGSFVYQDADDTQREELIDLNFLGSQRSFGGELQYLFRSRFFNLTSGFGYFDLNGDLRVTSGGVGLIEPLPLDLKHVNVYAYGYINLLPHVTLTVGASFDSTSGDPPGAGDDLFNPKFGLTWEPIPGTTLRAAAFRVVKRTLITDQTLEPTQVAGFNQFFDDVNLTNGWRYGGAIDQKFTTTLFGGVEFSKRELKVPFLDFTDFDNPTNAKANWDESLARAYLFWAPHAWFSLRAEYLFERFRRADELPEGVTALYTHRVPLGINFFHPSGLSASLTTTYWDQHGDFQSLLTGELRSGSDHFWLVDTAITYRMPKRFGFIAVGVTNLFDKEFMFFDDTTDNPIIQPDRRVFAKITLALP